VIHVMLQVGKNILESKLEDAKNAGHNYRPLKLMESIILKSVSFCGGDKLIWRISKCPEECHLPSTCHLTHSFFDLCSGL